MKVLYQAIWAKFAPVGAKPAFYTAVNGELHDSVAPTGTQLPYAVLTTPAEATEYFFGTAHSEYVRVAFDLYAADNSDANDLYEDLKTLFDNCTLSVTGFEFGKMERRTAQKLAGENYWRWIVEYVIWLHQST